MLPRRQKLDAHAVAYVREHADTVVKSPHFVVRACSRVEQCKAAVVVSKKIASGAVPRNRLRRRVYAALHAVFEELSAPLWAVVFVRQGASQQSVEQLERELRELFGRACERSDT
jgi:ribonuclease P protein component